MSDLAELIRELQQFHDIESADLASLDRMVGRWYEPITWIADRADHPA